MRYSRLFGKTKKQVRKYESINATLLQKAGFIYQTMAGVYTFLPLGLRVLTKIENIIREEMDNISSELLMPALSPIELWIKTERFDKVDVLMKTEGANATSRQKNSASYILNPTHEEVITPIAMRFNPSYKDFPFAVYQIQTKFRNEARTKSGLMRGREFRMKDLYSFHVSEADLFKFYDEVKFAYSNIFDRVGLGDETLITLASGGDFTTGFSHEFQTICETGEDLIFHAKSVGITYNREVAPSKAPEFSQQEEKKPLELIKTPDIDTLSKLRDFLKLPVHMMLKTILYKTNEKNIVVAVVRGDYEINEEKLLRVVGCKSLELADEQSVMDVTGAEVGYAGVIDLPVGTELLFDDSSENLVNFVCGANKSDCHVVNVNWGVDIERPAKFHDIKLAKKGDSYPETGEKYEVYKASEVGNIFPLNTKFSKAYEYYYTDRDGDQKPVYMGSYGIGTSRLMGVIVEKSHDDCGIIWPKSIAPYHIHLISLSDDESILEKAGALYKDLRASGVEVIWDDRNNVSAGEKFADADLIGIPMQITIGKKFIGTDVFECKVRRTNEKFEMRIGEILDFVRI